MTMEEIADRSIEINRNLRIALDELLGIAEGLGTADRSFIVPKIKAALDASKNMPTAHDIVAARYRS